MKKVLFHLPKMSCGTSDKNLKMPLLRSSYTVLKTKTKTILLFQKIEEIYTFEIIKKISTWLLLKIKNSIFFFIPPTNPKQYGPQVKAHGQGVSKMCISLLGMVKIGNKIIKFHFWFWDFFKTPVTSVSDFLLWTLFFIII